jgi:uncharacterized protein YndB with AHSA1/START domain/uncharacterized damage-inducible protein DinB
MSSELKVQQTVKATPDQVYFAFTHAISLTEWMCDFATVAARPGGRIYLWWHGDFYSAGEFISLEENKSIQFEWHSRQDPAPSQITVGLQEIGNNTLVTLIHSLPDGEYWSEHSQDFLQQWTVTLANLAQVLETGLDKRVIDRPMLGINVSDFNAEIAQSMGVPVSDGIRLDFLPEEMSAYQSGLRKDDVLISLDGKPITKDFESLVRAIQGKKCGDIMEAVFYRGPEKKSLPLELSTRPIPQIPWEPEKLAEVIRAKYDVAQAALEAAFQGIGESEASFGTSPNEWSAKEVLAHLIQTERHWLENLEDEIGGYPRFSDDWAGNCGMHVRAIVTAYGSTQGLLSEMRRLSDEMVAFVSALSAEFVARKASYFRIASMLIEGSLPHILSHINQIQTAITSAKKS